VSKSTVTYWNPLLSPDKNLWKAIAGLEGLAEELTLSIDEETGEYTRLTRFFPGADTSNFGGKTHTYPEEILIISGRLYDQTWDLWLETGHYASNRLGKFMGLSARILAVWC